MECIVSDETLHPGYCQYSLDDDSLLDYSAHRNYHAQPAPPCPGYGTVSLATTELIALRKARHDSWTDTPPPIETMLESGNGDTP